MALDTTGPRGGTGDPVARPAPAPIIVDLGYGVSTIAGRPGPDVTALCDAIDADWVALGGAQAAPAEHHWREFFISVLAAAGGRPLLVGYPSTWGGVRRAVLERAAAALPVEVTLVPRAVLIARSHADATVSRCAVVETTHLPRYPVDPMRRPVSAWDVARLRRGSGDWEIEGGGVLETGDAESSEHNADAEDVEALIDDEVEAVYLDGADAAEVTRAVGVVTAHALAGRVLPVNRRLIARWGGRSVRSIPPIEPPLDDHLHVHGAAARRGRLSRRRWVIAAAVAVAMVVAVAAVGVGFWQHRDTSQGPDNRMATVGRTTMMVPHEWRQSDPAAPSSGGGAASQRRTVFVAPDDGRRLVLVQSEVRSGSTQSSVATSMRNRIHQRGDDVVSEFSPSTRFAGREVISYREAPESGSAIRWYVLVADDLQVSVGCQAGTGGASVDTACADAVSSLRIAPR